MKRRTIAILFLILVIIVSFILIVIGIRFEKMYSPRKIFSNSIDAIKNQTKNMFELNSKYNLGDTFTVEGTFNCNIKSDYILNLSKTNPEYEKKLNIINNLNALDTKFSISQNSKEEISLVDILSKTKTKDILTSKYYVNNSTEYLFVNGIVKNYVNEGSSNYFEMLDEENTTKDNLDYLYDYLFESLKNNLKEEYFDVYKVKTNIESTPEEVNKITLELDNKRIIEILTGVLNDLKKDDRSYKILSSIDENFKNKKINGKKKYLNNKETISINIYTSKYMNKPLKYEVVHLKEDNKKIYSYIGNNAKGTLYYIENNELKYSLYATFNTKTIILDIMDKNNKKIGNFTYQKDENNVSIIADAKFEEMKYDISYISKYKNIKKNSYKNEKSLDIYISDNLESRLEGKYNLNYIVTKSTSIEEDISNAVLKSTLTKEETDKLDNIYDIVKTRLESK